MRDKAGRNGPEATDHTVVGADEVVVVGIAEAAEEVAAGVEIGVHAAAVVAEIAKANKLGAGITARSCFYL